MRLFVAVRPPPDVADVVAALPRPERHGIRWTRPDQWHITLRFLGEVDDPDAVASALAEKVPGTGAVDVTLGPATARLGRGVLVVPAAGLDALAARVLDATRTVVPVGDEAHGFHGHLTLARCPKGVPRWATGVAVRASWTATEVELVSSQLGKGPARHEVIASYEL